MKIKHNLKNRWNVITTYPMGSYTFKFEELVYFEDNMWHWEKWKYVLTKGGSPEEVEMYRHETYPRGHKADIENDAPWLKKSPRWKS